MTVAHALSRAHETLMRLDSPGLDSEALLAHILGATREYVLSHPEQILTDEQTRGFDELLARRTKQEPIAYLIREKEFYGRRFYVDKRVHIPKPATEDLIDAVKREVPDDFEGAIADIGTGSGCIAITLALEFPNARVIATDISAGALAVAAKNAHDHARIKASTPLGATRPLMERITFLGGNLLDPITAPIDIIIANLPYGWRDGWTEDREVFFQPEISYISGTDGLDAISALIRALPNLLTKQGRAFLEFDPRQAGTIKTLATQSGFDCAIIKDLSGFDRIACLTNEARGAYYPIGAPFAQL